MRTVAILQSNYLPWKGYFDIIRRADVFVFYDDRQYTKNDWRNRNRIKTRRGLEWLTVPCGPSHDRLISEVVLRDASWQKKHWRTLQHEYGKAPFFARYRPFFEDLYLGRRWSSLSELNQYAIRRVARDCLALDTRFEDSRDYELRGDGSARVLDLLGKTGADRYVTGPSARAYLDPAAFEAAGIELLWMDYRGYAEYPQFHPPFVHEVSIVDMLFHTGPAAKDLLCPRAGEADR